MGMFTSGLGAHLTWTLPFGLLVMFAIFNRFDGRYEEAARDLGATPWQTLALRRAADHPALGDRRRPVRLHAVVGRDRALEPGDGRAQHAADGVAGADDDGDQRPTSTRSARRRPRVSFAVIAIALFAIAILRARQARHGSDAGQA